MRGPFFTFLRDVPQRLARGFVLWAFVILTVLTLLVGAVPLGAKTDPATGEKYLTLYGADSRPIPEPGMPVVPPKPPREAARDWLAALFGLVVACYMGVFIGAMFLADAVSSAFAPGNAEFNLPRPVSRTTIVLARHAGALVVAAAFATLAVGGAYLIVGIRTGEFATRVLWAIPCSVATFGMMHALGSVMALRMQNALLGAFVSLGTWAASWSTTIAGDILQEGIVPFPILVKVGAAARVAHRILPRAYDLQGLAGRLMEFEGTRRFGSTEAGGVSGELELMGQCAVWWAIGLGLAIATARRRDF